MRTRILQVQPELWPSGYGEVIAMLDVVPELLVDRYGLALFEGTDNLGDYHAAAIRLPSGRLLGLLRHVGAPYEGVEVHADMHEDAHEAVGELLQAMELPDTAVTWIRDALVAPAPGPAERAH
jgi:hypothetical protein